MSSNPHLPSRRVYVRGQLLEYRKLAIRVRIENLGSRHPIVWFPVSQIVGLFPEDPIAGDSVSFECSRWLMEKNGIK